MIFEVCCCALLVGINRFPAFAHHVQLAKDGPYYWVRVFFNLQKYMYRRVTVIA
jgi:hypothetical protein